jgi:hypothetical protein
MILENDRKGRWPYRRLAEHDAGLHSRFWRLVLASSGKRLVAADVRVHRLWIRKADSRNLRRFGGFVVKQADLLAVQV